MEAGLDPVIGPGRAISLHTKFTVLTACMVLTVIGGLGVAAWSVWLLDRELANPHAATATVLETLRSLKGASAQQSALLRSGQEESVRIAELVEQIESHAALVEGGSMFDGQFGRSSTRTLLDRVEEAQAMVRASVSRPEETPNAAAALDRVVALIDRMEGRVLREADRAVRHGHETVRRTWVVLASAFAIAVLIAFLRVILDRRWVMEPVGRLREAASEIADGNLDHRIDVVGDDELASLSDEVNHMAAMVSTMQAERVERARLAAIGEMVRRIVHNLRNPLAGIRGLAELTLEDLPPDGRMADKQSRIIATIDRFEQWLTELLDATSPLNVLPRDCEVRPWLESLVDAHRALAERRSIDLRVEAEGAPARALLDPRHADHALTALLTNAIEATPRDSVVWVVVACDAEHWTIDIADQGAGVDPELREKIFTPYFTTKRDGNGIGLAVARQIARAHGGDLELRPVQEVTRDADRHSGAIFRLRFPLGAPRRQGEEEGD